MPMSKITFEHIGVMDLTQTFHWNLWESGKVCCAISTSIFPLLPKFLDFMRAFCFNLLNFLSKQKVMIAKMLKFKPRSLKTFNWISPIFSSPQDWGWGCWCCSSWSCWGRWPAPPRGSRCSRWLWWRRREWVRCTGLEVKGKRHKN